MGYHWECKYCDCTRAVPYPGEPDFLVCARCGAEWEDCKIQVPDDEYDEEDESIWLCIDAFKKDGNTEHLVDASKYLMFRHMHPLPGECFKATSSSESVGTVGTPINMER